MIGGVRLAVWSGPRNISTALMRSWENRPDTRVVDEPLYAYYLNETGLNHPGREEVIAAGETSWRAVVDELSASLPVPNRNAARISRCLCRSRSKKRSTV